MKYLLACLMFVWSVQIASATTWYADNSRHDDSATCTQAQTQATAKKTIASALACVGSASSTAGAGHTVEVVAGTYAAGLIDAIPSGVANNYFTLKCQTDFACSLNPNGATAAIGINKPSSYITIRGFKTIGGAGWYLSGAATSTHHHITIEYNEWVGSTMHGDAMGIQASGANAIVVRYNKIYGLIGGIGPFAGLSHAIYPSANTTNWTIEYNEFYNNGAYGITLYDFTDNPSGFIIRHNLTYNNAAAGIHVEGGANHSVYNNISFGNFGGILFRGGSGTIYNNTVYTNAEGGIYDDYNDTRSYTCKNNLAISNGVQVRNCSSASNNTTSTSH
jgi:parallel beta-helix repeat protein